MKMIMASRGNIDDIVSLRVDMQIEDWHKTRNEDFSCYADKFKIITKKHLENHLNENIYFAVMYLDGTPIAICALEELHDLPQITVCSQNNGRHCCLVSVYTKPVYRGYGYQQKLIDFLLGFARKEGFNDITLTANTPDAIHIYEKFGFEMISNKYFLAL